MEEDPPTPFWVQPSSRRGRNGRRQQLDSSSIFMSSGVLVAVLILAAVTLFLFFVIPSVVDLARRTFKASLVRRGWDWVNLVLVIFAIVCGFLGRKDDDDQARSYSDPRQDHVEQMHQEQQRGLPSDSPKQWYEQSEKMEYRYAYSSSLKRTSSSYPDLKLESRWIHEGDWPRSFDDTYIDGYDQLRSAGSIGQHHRIGDDLIEEKHITEDLEVQTIESRAQASSLAIPSSPFLATASRSKSSRQPRLERRSTTTTKVKRKARQELEPIGHEDRHNDSIFIKESDRKKPQLPTPPAAMRSPPPPPPPPPLRMKAIAEDDRGGRSDKKRGGMNKDFLTSLYQPKKRKQRQKQKSLENLQSLSFSNPTIHFPSSSAPPPTPPPLPPPPPPGQLGSIRVRPTNRGSKSTPENTRKETLPTFKKHTLNLIEDYSSSGNNSPSIPIPPPPPPPPFKTPPSKFVDYKNIVESVNDSPPPDYSEEEGAEASSSSSKGTISATTLFCPSPDVNIKADDFITRFRAKLKLERLHSINKKPGSAVSPLGQDSSMSPSPSPSPVWMRDSL
ncbi:hypothetical protein Drorol1_Dr00000458 [Drosera rotundifolia]